METSTVTDTPASFDKASAILVHRATEIIENGITDYAAVADLLRKSIEADERFRDAFLDAMTAEGLLQMVYRAASRMRSNAKGYEPPKPMTVHSTPEAIRSIANMERKRTLDMLFNGKPLRAHTGA